MFAGIMYITFVLLRENFDEVGNPNYYPRILFLMLTIYLVLDAALFLIYIISDRILGFKEYLYMLGFGLALIIALSIAFKIEAVNKAHKQSKKDKSLAKEPITDQ